MYDSPRHSFIQINTPINNASMAPKSRVINHASLSYGPDDELSSPWPWMISCRSSTCRCWINGRRGTQLISRFSTIQHISYYLDGEGVEQPSTTNFWHAGWWIRWREPRGTTCTPIVGRVLNRWVRYFRLRIDPTSLVGEREVCRWRL